MKIKSTSRYVFLGTIINIVLLGLIYSFSNRIDLSKPNEISCVNQKINAICKENNLEFAGEKVPVDDPEVYERLDRELLVNTYWQSNTLITLKLAQKYLPEIEPILKQYGVPDDFKYLTLAESGLKDVVSPSGAAGKWQILKETGKQYGLIINDEVDERYDLQKATQAACQYFLEAYQKLGNWTAVAASYNMGVVGISKKMNEQIDNDYYNLWLNQETARYVFRVIALKEIHKNPTKFGFYFDSSDMYLNYRIQLDTAKIPLLDLAVYAKEKKTNYKTLRTLNPWLRSNKLSQWIDTTVVLKLPAN
jgi:hypothetical protein